MWASIVTESASSMPRKRCEPAVGDHEEPAVGGIDVEPGAVLGGQLGEIGQWIDRPGVGIARGRDQEPWLGARGPILGQPAPQRLDVDATVPVSGHEPRFAVSDATEPQALVDRVVHARGEVEHGRRSDPAVLTGAHDRGLVRQRPTREQDSFRVGGHPEDVGDPPRDALLQGDQRRGLERGGGERVRG